MSNTRPQSAGRGSVIRPPSRFDTTRVLPLDTVEVDAPPADPHPDTQFLPDRRTKSVVTENDSPDIGFRFSLNPYRGCEHGCAYCYARPTHEYLGYDAGLGFETKIVVKHDAPKLFRAFLARDSWVPEPVALSGVTDPYQPGERRFRVTRKCIEVAAAANQPIGTITKSTMVLRDLDLLGPMSSHHAEQNERVHAAAVTGSVALTGVVGVTGSVSSRSSLSATATISSTSSAAASAASARATDMRRSFARPRQPGVGPGVGRGEAAGVPHEARLGGETGPILMAVGRWRGCAGRTGDSRRPHRTTPGTCRRTEGGRPRISSVSSEAGATSGSSVRNGLHRTALARPDSQYSTTGPRPQVVGG